MKKIEITLNVLTGIYTIRLTKRTGLSNTELNFKQTDKIDELFKIITELSSKLEEE